MLAGFSRRWFKVRRTPGGPRVLSADFAWHYAVSSDSEYEEALAILRKGLPPTSFVKPISLQVKQRIRQPKWDLRNPPDLRFDDREWEPEEVEIDEAYREIWACYLPFHIHCHKGGIYLWPEGVASCARAFRQAVAQRGGQLTDRAAITWALPFLYWHELVHHTVEDLVSALEFMTEDDSIYRHAHNRWSGFIVMEEAIANSLAFTVQSECLNSRPRHGTYEQDRRRQAQYDRKVFKPDQEPIIDPPLMLEALKDVLKAQPVGYRNFIDFGSDWPPLLVRNLYALITLLYLNDHLHRSYHWRGHPYFHELEDLLIVLEKLPGEALHPWHYDNTLHWQQPNG